MKFKTWHQTLFPSSQYSNMNVQSFLAAFNPCPSQKNSNDCGLFAVGVAATLACVGGSVYSRSFTQPSMRKLRQDLFHHWEEPYPLKNAITVAYELKEREMLRPLDEVTIPEKDHPATKPATESDDEVEYVCTNPSKQQSKSQGDIPIQTNTNQPNTELIPATSIDTKTGPKSTFQPGNSSNDQLDSKPAATIKKKILPMKQLPCICRHLTHLKIPL